MLPKSGSKPNKLDGSFFLLPETECLAASASLLVLLLSVLCNLFKELFLHTPKLPSASVLTALAFVLESGCKGMTFFRTCKIYTGKSLKNRAFLTSVHSLHRKRTPFTLLYNTLSQQTDTLLKYALLPLQRQRNCES